jgi:hypothetical protein
MCGRCRMTHLRIHAVRAHSLDSLHSVSRASLNLITEPGLYMLLRFQKAAVRGTYETEPKPFQSV